MYSKLEVSTYNLAWLIFNVFFLKTRSFFVAQATSDLLYRPGKSWPCCDTSASPSQVLKFLCGMPSPKLEFSFNTILSPAWWWMPITPLLGKISGHRWLHNKFKARWATWNFVSEKFKKRFLLSSLKWC